MTPQQLKRLIRPVALVLVAVVAYLVWRYFGAEDAESGIVSGNGRIEAVEVDIAARSPGRVREIRVREGDLVATGQVLAVMDTDVLQAERRQAEAQLQQANSAVATAKSQITQRESERAAAQAVVRQRRVEFDAARAHLERVTALVTRGYISQQVVDDARERMASAEAAIEAARAQVRAIESAIASARTQAAGVASAAVAAQANIDRIQADIDDTVLESPAAGRVQYIVARPGEVIGAGGRVLTLLDLSDVYMTFFVPTAAAGRVAIGTEVRIVLDAAPQYVIPANVSFVADVAQFTPKTVETASEREKLMFRVRARVSPELVSQYIPRVKTGLPGVAYLRLDPAVSWPARLQVNLPR